MPYIFLWSLNESIEIRTNITEAIIKVSNADNHLYLLTKSYSLYHGVIQNTRNSPYVDLTLCNYFKLIDVDCFKDEVYIVNLEGYVFRCTTCLDVMNEIVLVEDCLCSRGHSRPKCKIKVKNIAVSEYGKLFITELGHLWASGYMPQIGINSEIPKRVNFFIGRQIHNVNIGHDFAIVIVSKLNNDDFDSDDEEVFLTNCPQCLSASQLTSPASNISLSEMIPLGIKIQGSYDIETTSTSSKNDSSSSESDKKNNAVISENEMHVEKNIIFRNTEAARDFLTKQISRMSSAGEEYLVECTEKPTRIIKENMTNVASFVYEGVKTVGDRVVTLSRHMSGSSDCNSIIENNHSHLLKTSSKEDFAWSLSQCTSEKDLSEQDFKENLHMLLKKGSSLLNCEVWTWGNIIHGQLGIGDNIKRERPMIITKISNIGVQKISVQSFHASVITLDGRAFIWGRNDFNQVTLESNCDQSSPKLYNTSKDERIKDIVCGKHFTILLNNKNIVIPLFNNLLSSTQFTVMNGRVINCEEFSRFLIEIQKLLEEMLVVQINLIKPLQKKNANSSNGKLFENFCRNYINVMKLLAIDVYSLLEYENNLISFCDIAFVKHIDEHLFTFKEYLAVLYSVVTIDGFNNISKLIEVSQSLYKLRLDLVTKRDKCNEEILVSKLFLSPVDILPKLVNFVKFMIKKEGEELNDIIVKLTEFVDDNNANLRKAEETREFWLNTGRSIDFLKQPERRLIFDSHSRPINFLNASRFSSHYFILFNDIFVHMIGSTYHIHNLSTIWVEPQQDEASQLYQLILKMPEETITLCTSEPEVKIDWFHVMQTTIKNALNKSNSLQPPSARNGTFTFTKNGFLKDATYSGRWLNAKMQGKGKLEWPDGKIYTGQFSNNQLCGYGTMYTPNEGTYEGQWKDNLQNGYGILTYINTDIYKGHFKDGLPHGHGFLRKGNFMANSASFYIGDWMGGAKNGYGVLDDIVTGEKYIGNWYDNKKQGNGLIITADGVYYEGVFSQDVLTGYSIMVLEDGTHYEGEFKGTGILNGKGILTLPTGDFIEGNLNGSIDEGIKISSGIFIKTHEKKKLPKSFGQLCTPVDQKWKALFRYFHQSIGIPENTKNGIKLDTQKIWQNVAVVLSNATNLTRDKEGNDKLPTALKNLDIIPPFGRDVLDMDTCQQVKHYLIKAFDSSFHPLGSLLISLSEAYTTTYGGRAHILLLNHAIDELHYITMKLYEIIRHLFPALPVHHSGIVIKFEKREELVTFHTLLYPLILPKFHHPLFTLFTLKNEHQERQYKKILIEWNKQSDITLMNFLSVDPKFYNTEAYLENIPKKNHMFLDAIENLQQIKSTFSPTEKLLVIRETVEKLTPVVQNILGSNYVWNMDDLFPIFLFVVVRSRIPDLGSELDFMDSFMDSNLESGELGIMFTTLKACYQQILQEKSSTYE
ncbi:hypothetical protein HHI36_004772 [Cryptolaemus montrouzieri]|uniref:VPS9 domain-containing protein n=1 Tax=Cryptolaemus montrouzieri TaxID=559131 RepID=A0ABD2NSH2_9CUCU